MPLRLQSVCLYRSYRQEARQAAAAACSSPAAFLKGIGLRIYGNAVSAQRISVNLGAARCSQCLQGNAGKYTFRRLLSCGSLCALSARSLLLAQKP